ncbi:hypothetical protein M3650_26225 [Paenibacillus sp. MER TA 81-3]|uniref:hypothetical protein n=1 Tax=Paenibacillus sp. MER TA 81-3 TaxID=2939573 RepID=UPI00203D7B27|nr:hypothetical protein [Paenibacillus sp. MER TA 81-3]MCM3342027.1 hypothetical protein [Paenibacillus sp. MER TA 81-3]
MAIRKDDVLKLFEQLPEAAQQSAIDYLQFLVLRHQRPDWDEISELAPDDIPLNEDERRQLDSDSGFMSWEEAMNELDLPTDTKP